MIVHQCTNAQQRRVETRLQQTHKRTRERERSRARDTPTWTDDIFQYYRAHKKCRVVVLKIVASRRKKKEDKKKKI